MADLIRIKGGIGDVPDLQDRELAYSKDQQALYIGSDNENTRLCGAGDAARIEALYAAISELSAKIDGIIARLDGQEQLSE